jgi:phosphoribosylformylglycinamidine (FGAM) synthase PurS component
LEFNPPIESRETDELIVMSKSSTDEYQARAIKLALKELANRKFSQADIDSRYEELLEEQDKVIQQELAEMMAEDYSVFEKLYIIAFWPLKIFDGWYLGKYGYTTKASNRIKLILIGIALYAILIFISI